MKNIEHHLLIGRNSSNTHITQIVEPMLAKFYKYWQEMKLFAAIANVFDPRSKLSYIEFKLREKGEAPEIVAVDIENIQTALYSWYKEYVKASENEKPPASRKEDAEDIICIGEAEDEDALAFRQHLARTKGIGSTSAPTGELDLYLQENNVIIPSKANFDLLEWWRINSLRFPTLGQLARTVLMIPATSVASESAFSASGRVLDDFRTSLNPDTLEALVCTQDWLHGLDEANNLDDV